MAISDFGQRWEGACGHAKGKVIAEMCEHFGWSKQTCYRKLAAAGFESGKKKREDKGQSSMSKEDLQILSGMLREGIRKNGKAQLGIPEARSIMAMNGFDMNVGNRQLARLLEQLGMSAKTLRTPRAHTHLQSLHPNHVWQLDPSFCTLYYLKSGKQVIIEDDEAYKNKHDIYAKLQKKNAKVWRYVLTDHYSGYTFVRYYQTDGETQQVAFDFFLQAAAKKEHNPFCGVPKILLWDKGSANKAKAMTSALNALGVEVISHAVGKSNVKGSVENANNRVECSFEIRLRFEPLHSIEELNSAAEAYFIAYNANLIEAKDCRLKRQGNYLVREKLWLSIKQDELRILPDISLCRQLLARPAEVRTVRKDGCISVVHHFTGESGLYLIANVVPGDKINVQCLAYEGAAILVHYRDVEGQKQTQRIKEPLPINDAGFVATAAVIGEEYKAAPNDQNEKQRQQLEKLAHPNGKKKSSVPFAHLNEGRGLQSHNQIIGAVNRHNEKLLRLPLRGVPVALGDAQIFEAEYNLPEALARLKNELEESGHKYSKTYVELVRKQMRGGKITEAKLEGIFQFIAEENGEYSKHA